MTASPRESHRFELPPVARKILISLLSGGIAYMITQLAPRTDDSPDTTLWQLTIAIFIAGVVLVVQFIVSLDERMTGMEARQEGHHSRVKALVEQKFSEINEATALFGLVENSALEPRGVIQLIHNSTKIGEATTPIARKLADSEIERISSFLKELGNSGVASYNGEDQDWILALTTHAKHTLDATSPSTVDGDGDGFDGGFWFTELGQRYLSLQRDLVRRGGQVRRVFILSSRHLEDPSFLKVCRSQKEAGVQVRVLTPSMSTDIPRSAVAGFIVFDEELNYEVTPSPTVTEVEGPTIVHTRLVTQTAQVAERVRHFTLLWENAQEVDC
ncbi:DUF6879 family protein [Actinocorallia libanotica]|uniref:DUF6879 domain-containing protein n=1 Tax=Actinocorallia libanotica TaxID=46162 RepID=A0ABP4CCT4_9ACTN